MPTFANYSTLTSTPTSIRSDTLFTMSVPSVHSTPTTVCSSPVSSLKGPRHAYKQVVAKLRAGLNALRLKTKKVKEPVTGGQLAPVTANASAEQFGRPTRAIFLPDAYYGWGHTAKVSARFITTLFDCPSTLPVTNSDYEYPDLTEFIAYALFICQLEPEVNDYAMCLLWRLKVECPGARFAYVHGMYLAALSLAAKMAGQECSSEDWVMVGQEMFGSEQLEVYQQRLGGHLLWELEIDLEEMTKIMRHVQRGEQPNMEPIHLPPDDDDDCADSIRTVSTSSSLWTCTIASSWSVRSMRGWDDSTRQDSAVTTLAGEKVNTSPYADVESWRSLPGLTGWSDPSSCRPIRSPSKEGVCWWLGNWHPLSRPLRG